MSRNIYFISGGGFGTDAGGWYIGPDGKIHKVPPWNPESINVRPGQFGYDPGCGQ
jgi:hypothetical protein